MKTYTRIFAAASGLVLAAALPASAQHNMTAQVPFEFMVGGDTLPRDVYRVSRDQGTPGVLILRSERRAIVILGRRAESEDNAEKPKLVFHRLGDQYFLREIRFLGNIGLSLPETREERQAAERRADGSPAGRQKVVVAAQPR